ncbi:hypothetical protein QYF36_005246 [Acer negundo]|nr:hypothetical protein QYF36_005246 [Acer negundo]
MIGLLMVLHMDQVDNTLSWGESQFLTLLISVIIGDAQSLRWPNEVGIALSQGKSQCLTILVRVILGATLSLTYEVLEQMHVRLRRGCCLARPFELDFIDCMVALVRDTRVRPAIYQLTDFRPSIPIERPPYIIPIGLLYELLAFRLVLSGLSLHTCLSICMSLCPDPSL